MRQAQDADPDDPFTAGIRESYNHLAADRTATLAALTELDTQDAAEPTRPTPADAALLDHLPVLAANLTQAPQELQRQLYQATRLTIGLHHDTHEVTMTIRLPANDLDTITGAAVAASPETPPDQPNSVDAVGAPGATRTHTGRILSPLPLPIGLRGPH